MAAAKTFFRLEIFKGTLKFGTLMAYGFLWLLTSRDLEGLASIENAKIITPGKSLVFLEALRHTTTPTSGQLAEGGVLVGSWLKVVMCRKFYLHDEQWR